LLFYYLVFFRRIEFTKKIKIILIIFIIPIISYEIIKNEINNYKLQQNNETVNIKNRFFSTNSITNNDGIEYQDYTSGRIEIWKRSLEIIKNKKIIFGYGPMADRFLLIKDENKNKPEIYFWDNNSSNALIYSYLSGGVVSFFSLILIYILTLKEILISTYTKKIFMTKDISSQFSIITLSFLIIRSVFENSFALFGIDLIIFFTCYYILTKYKSIKIFK
jgi:O-antigen ligase